MDVKVIKSRAAYEAALRRLVEVIGRSPAAGSAEADELELLSLVIEAWEREQAPVSPPDPVEAIMFRLDQAGLKRKDLIPYLGSPSRVSEVLGRRRPLTLAMIRRLRAGLGIPAESLLAGPQQVRRRGSAARTRVA